jgi:hypothetical protein
MTSQWIYLALTRGLATFPLQVMVFSRHCNRQTPRVLRLSRQLQMRPKTSTRRFPDKDAWNRQ